MKRAQWPNEEDLPGFRAVVTEYYARLTSLSYEFTELIAEALGLRPDGLSAFFEAPEHIQHRGKIVKYPSPKDAASSDQGVGAHFDAGFLTLLLQASPHRGLQVQSSSGTWIDAPPMPDTLVVNFGKGLEAATRGLAQATSHRVLSPPVGSTPRYSIPFFQRISQKIVLTQHIPECMTIFSFPLFVCRPHISLLPVPFEILKLKEERGEFGSTDCTFLIFLCINQPNLVCKPSTTQNMISFLPGRLNLLVE